MKNYDQSVEINHNTNWPYWPYIYLYVKDPFKSKFQLLLNGREKVELKKLKIQKRLLIIQKECLRKFGRYK